MIRPSGSADHRGAADLDAQVVPCPIVIGRVGDAELGAGFLAIAAKEHHGGARAAKEHRVLVGVTLLKQLGDDGL